MTFQADRLIGHKPRFIIGKTPVYAQNNNELENVDMLTCITDTLTGKDYCSFISICKLLNEMEKEANLQSFLINSYGEISRQIDEIVKARLNERK